MIKSLGLSTKLTPLKGRKRAELVIFAQGQGCILKNQVKLDLGYIPDYQGLVIGVTVRR